MDTIAAHAARHPARVALIEGERSITWGDLRDQSNRLASSLLDLGLAPGEHMAVYASNSLENVLALTAVRTIGGITLPLNHRLVAEEVAYIVDDSDAVAVFVSDQFLPVVEQVRSRAGRRSAAGSCSGRSAAPGPNTSTTCSRPAAPSRSRSSYRPWPA